MVKNLEQTEQMVLMEFIIKVLLIILLKLYKQNFKNHLNNNSFNQAFIKWDVILRQNEPISWVRDSTILKTMSINRFGKIINDFKIGRFYCRIMLLIKKNYYIER